MSLYTLSNVRQTYGLRTVLQVPALTIEPGEIVAVVGPSGAGKSTLLRLLALLEAPSQGNVELNINDHRVTYGSASIGERRQLVMMFQRPILLSRSVQANIAYGLGLRGERMSRERIADVLRQVALAELANAQPRTLSGGELQRTALARALVLDPRVLLLDEPTANLDPHNVQLVENLIQKQHTQRSTTIILVTHNFFQARRLATRVVLLLQGELIEVAPTETFFNAPRDPRTLAYLSGRLVY
jgi:tungstate transport system ATP-binding protein